MRIKLLLVILILIFISGCIEQNGEIKPTFDDNALSMEIKIREKEESRRILPGQTIRMIVRLKNQVEDETKNVDLNITNPAGIHISKVDCGYGCVCEGPDEKGGCDEYVDCSFNGCHYESIQSLDTEEITFGIKIPSEDEMSSMGRDLNPKIVLSYDYSGTSALYVPIYREGEIPADVEKEFTQTTGPIHVEIDSDDWVREGDLFPVYVDVKDVVRSSEKLTIDKNEFEMTVKNVEISGDIGRCDFNLATIETCADIGGICELVADCTDGYDCYGAALSCEPPTGCCCVESVPLSRYNPIKNVSLPLSNPLVCTLKASSPTAPMVKAPIIIEYSYRYRVEKTETIRVEKAFLRIF